MTFAAFSTHAGPLATAVMGGPLAAVRPLSAAGACLLAASAIWGTSPAALRRRMAEPGEAVAGGLVAAVLALALAHPLDRWVDLFPTQPGQRWGGSLLVWSAIALTGLVVTVVSTRDPLDRRG